MAATVLILLKKNWDKEIPELGRSHRQLASGGARILTWAVASELGEPEREEESLLYLGVIKRFRIRDKLGKMASRCFVC